MITDRCRSRPRRGYALLAALWLVVALSTLGAVSVLASREALAAASNRTALVRGSWRAQGCAERARAALDALLDAARAHPDGVFERWRVLDRSLEEVAPAPSWRPCAVRLQPVGERVDLNALDPVAFGVLLRALSVPGRRADALARALDTWRAGVDSNTSPAPAAVTPRAGSSGLRRLAAVAELRDVPGFDSGTVATISEVADVEPGRLSLAHASPPALASLPGFGPEAVTAVLDRRARGLSLDLADIMGSVSPLAATDLRNAAGQIARRATADPDAWLLKVSSSGDGATAPPVRASFVLRLARAGTRVVVMRRRSAW